MRLPFCQWPNVSGLGATIYMYKFIAIALSEIKKLVIILSCISIHVGWHVLGDGGMGDLQNYIVVSEIFSKKYFL